MAFPSDVPGQPEPLSSWYFDFSPMSNAPRSITSPDWETVESLMGVSRGVMELFNRVSMLYSVSRPPPGNPRDGGPPPPVDEMWIGQANLLLVEIDRWGAAYKDTRLTTRIDYGNQVYVQFFKVRC